ncbi:hypothetical protein ACMZ29_00645 [Brevibacterium casei]|uniref:VG15 protein n=1 Tax=Brevibacterium casei TaxID=33889 RepID=UPI0039EF8255
MSTQELIRSANAHKRRTDTLTRAAFVRSAAAWRNVNPASIVESWQILMGTAVTAIVLAQRDAMTTTENTTTTALTEQGIDFDAAPLRADAIAGTMPGTSAALDSALAGVAFHTLDRVGSGVVPSLALQQGLVELSALVQVAVADAARATATIRLGQTKQKVSYVRVASAGCCARCAVLAGRTYAWNSGFLRHPRCRCLHFPTTTQVASAMAVDPYEQFEALPTAEQDRVYTKSGAEAIRQGADINQVVNARRGMSASGRFTNEGQSRRGYYRQASTAGRAGKRRLSVDELLRRSNGDKAKFVDLLTEYGYFV